MTVKRYTAKITTVDPANDVVGFVTKGDAQERYATVMTTQVAFRWPIEGETWLVKEENGSWYLDGLLPNTVNNGIQGVVPGDAVINSPTGVVIIQGSEDGSTNFTFDATTYLKNNDTAGGDLAGTYPNPHIAPVVTALPGSPVDGQEISYLAEATNGVVWKLKYRAASTSSHKWEFVGGGPIMLGPQGSITTASGTYVALTGGPSWTVPIAGDYEIGLYGASQVSVASSVTNQSWILMFNGTFGGYGAYIDAGGAAFVGGTTSFTQRANGLTVGEVVSLGVASSNGATSVQFTNGELVIRPIRIG